MSKTKEKGFVGVIFLIVVAVIGAGFFLYKSNYLKVESIPKEKQDTSPSPSSLIVYKNSIHGFQFEYSPIFAFEKSSDGLNAYLIPSGAEEPSNEKAILITVRHKTGDEESSKTPLTEYAKIAATQEIQNYNSLSSIETITTKSGEVGYKTTWNRSGPVMNGVVLNSTDEPSDPITYFSLPKEPYYTVQFYLEDSKYLEEYNQIIATYSTE